MCSISCVTGGISQVLTIIDNISDIFLYYGDYDGASAAVCYICVSNTL